VRTAVASTMQHVTVHDIVVEAFSALIADDEKRAPKYTTRRT
jgi:hypothetical protein